MQRHPKHLIITYSCSNDNKKILYIIYAKSLPLFEVMSTIYSRMKKKKMLPKANHMSSVPKWVSLLC